MSTYIGSYIYFPIKGKKDRMPKLLSHQSRSISVVMPGFIQDVDISQVKQSPNIFRRSETEVEQLSTSIQHIGLLQPILVRTLDDHYEIVAGNRRFLACKYLGWKKIGCHIIELDDKRAFEISLVENIQKKTLSPIEEATAFKVYVADFGWGGVSDLSARIGKSVSYITKRIKLLNLPLDVLQSITNNKIETSIAEELLSIKDKDRQSMLANLISDRRLSMRATRRLVKNLDEQHSDFITKTCNNEYIDHMRLAERSFDKSIAAIRIAMNSLREVINSVEHDWIVYEVLMQHKNMLHTQIDILLKEKRKL
jgi:ParB family transcriptional regulator, chromosome partitioning protein